MRCRLVTVTKERCYYSNFRISSSLPFSISFLPSFLPPFLLTFSLSHFFPSILSFFLTSLPYLLSLPSLIHFSFTSLHLSFSFSHSIEGRILFGRSMLDLITEITAITGRMKPLPQWTQQGAVAGLEGGTEVIQYNVSCI